jgi:hypothetical protein
MATYSKLKLSGSTSGRPILVDTATLTSGAITAVSASAGTVTYTASNTFTAGTIVTISNIISSTNTTGALNAGYNLANVAIATASSTQFTVTNGATGTWTSGGVATANPATMTTIHATDANATTIDEVWLYATNTSLAPITLTLFYGGSPTGGTDSLNAPSYISIPPQSGLTLITPGLILTGTTAPAATTIYASASVASDVTISGYVNRIV